MGWMGGIAHEVEQLPTGNRCLGYRPSEPEITPDILQKNACMLVTQTRFDQLEVRFNGVAQRLNPGRIARGNAAGLFKPALQFRPFCNEQPDRPMPRG